MPPRKSVEAAVLTIVIVGLVAALAMVLSGLAPSPWYVVESRSMEPLLHVGDLVIALPVDPHDIKCGPDGDVIIYRRLDGGRVIHRAISKVEVGGRLYFLTKGDNNPGPDQDPLDISTWLPEDRIIAKMVFSIPIVGYPFLERFKPYTQAVLLAALAYVLYSTLTSPRSKKGQRRVQGGKPY